MLGGLRFAHITLHVTAPPDVTTDRTIRNYQGSEHLYRTVWLREPEAMYADNADGMSSVEQDVLYSARRNDSGP
ncbi:MAG: hypothetical protein K0S79_2569 [Nitrospira sp.]|jgi:hypothetical protein|nr:hypothetical protein [Nitrospira sp.]